MLHMGDHISLVKQIVDDDRGADSERRKAIVHLASYPFYRTVLLSPKDETAG